MTYAASESAELCEADVCISIVFCIVLLVSATRRAACFDATVRTLNTDDETHNDDLAMLGSQILNIYRNIQLVEIFSAII